MSAGVRVRKSRSWSARLRAPRPRSRMPGSDDRWGRTPVGDLEEDTAVERVSNGRYRATVSSDWALWGPVGGYLASIALRAAGAHSALPLPASLSCQYLSRA